MAYPPGTSHDDKNSEGIDNVQGHSLLVEDCYIHNIATTGVYFKGGAMNCIIQRTKVERCGNSGILLGFDTSPEYFNLETNPDYYENINGTVRNCLVIDTNYEGIGLYASKDAHVYNNTLVNVGKNGVHSAIYLGVATQDWDENAKRPPNINPSIYNNIVKQSKGVNNLMVAIRYSQDLGGLSGLSGKANIDNNLYYIDGEHALFIDSRPAYETEKITLKDWANHIDGDKLSFEEEPLLDSEYRQIKNSPCIDKGKNISSFNDDFDKKTRDSKFDIGCYEF